MPIEEKAVRYTPTHEWVYLEGDVATVGVSRFAVEQLSDLILIDLKPAGTKVAAGKSFGEIESVKAVSDLYAPVDGEIIEVNPAVTSDVQQLVRDPYQGGWLVKIRLSDPMKLPTLLDLDSYLAKVSEDHH